MARHSRAERSGKAALNVAKRAAAVGAVDQVEGAAEERPEPEHGRHRQQPDAGDDGHHGQVLEPMLE